MALLPEAGLRVYLYYGPRPQNWLGVAPDGGGPVSGLQQHQPKERGAQIAWLRASSAESSPPLLRVWQSIRPRRPASRNLARRSGPNASECAQKEPKKLAAARRTSSAGTTAWNPETRPAQF